MSAHDLYTVPGDVLLLHCYCTVPVTSSWCAPTGAWLLPDGHCVCPAADCGLQRVAGLVYRPGHPGRPVRDAEEVFAAVLTCGCWMPDPPPVVTCCPACGAPAEVAWPLTRGEVLVVPPTGN